MKVHMGIKITSTNSFIFETLSKVMNQNRISHDFI